MWMVRTCQKIDGTVEYNTVEYITVKEPSI